VSEGKEVKRREGKKVQVTAQLNHLNEVLVGRKVGLVIDPAETVWPTLAGTILVQEVGRN